MKRFFTFILVLVLAFPITVFATDYSTMSDDELYEELNLIRAEMVNRISSEDEDKVLVDADGITVTLKGEPELKESYDGSKYLVFSVTIVNSSTEVTGVRTDDCYLNGWQVSSDCLAALDAGTKVKSELTIFKVDEDAEVDSIEDLEDLKLVFLTYDANTYVTKTNDISTVLTF